MMHLGKDVLEIAPQLDEEKRNGFSPPFPYHISFHTDDIEEAVKTLNDHGIETTEIGVIPDSRLDALKLRVIEYDEPEPFDPKLLGCLKPSVNEEQPWKIVRFNDPDGIILEIWQRR
jgi:catechol 2,3-dioxygenase-like lactoylglutathione lyase family enzyme